MGDRRSSFDPDVVTAPDPAELRERADRVLDLSDRKHTVYVYFNNDWQGFAVLNAFELRELLGAVV
jgi:uncharacterized protein YecE (DUF72 family)